MISIRNVTKAFGQVRAVDGVSFEIRRGEFFSLLGPSGCGKTTLLRMLAGFGDADRGRIFIDGQPMSMTPPNLRPTNMVFQSYAIFPISMCGRTSATAWCASGFPGGVERDCRSRPGVIKLPGYGERMTNQLSGGQRQRVAFGQGPGLPTEGAAARRALGALDKKVREEMQLELRQIQRSVGITFVFVTHDQEEALTMSDRIAVMSKSHALQIDTAAGPLRAAEDCREVADFIGTMNFFEGRVLSIDGNVARVSTETLGILQAGRCFCAARSQHQGLCRGAPRELTISTSETRVGNAVPGHRQAGSLSLATVATIRRRRWIEKPIAVATQNIRRDAASATTSGEQVRELAGGGRILLEK